jgi:arsenate reductase
MAAAHSASIPLTAPHGRATPEHFLRAVGDETRLRALLLLWTQGELCVCDLTEALALSQPKVSRHLATLRDAALVEDRRRGQWVFYRLRADLPGWMRDALRALADGARLFSLYRDDRLRLLATAAGPGRPIADGGAPIPALEEREPMATEETDKTYNVLFLCTGNSARSVFAERLIERWGRGRFKGFSAGSRPKGEIHPMALAVLEQNNYVTDGLRSKSWKEFSGPKAPTMDFVFTVCDNAAAEECPVWPGQPMTAHWGVTDPAQAEGNEAERMLAFHAAFNQLQNRISIFVNLPIESIDTLKLQKELDRIGKPAAATAASGKRGPTLH